MKQKNLILLINLQILKRRNETHNNVCYFLLRCFCDLTGNCSNNRSIYLIISNCRIILFLQYPLLKSATMEEIKHTEMSLEKFYIPLYNLLTSQNKIITEPVSKLPSTSLNRYFGGNKSITIELDWNTDL